MEESNDEFSDELDEFEESVDETKQKPIKNQTTFSNKPYDEAFEVSQDLSVNESFDGREKIIAAANKPRATNINEEKAEKGLKKVSEQSKSQSVLNKPFDEALEFSQSGSEESVDTRASQTKNYMSEKLHNEIKPIVQSQTQSVPKQTNAPIISSQPIISQKSQPPIITQVTQNDVIKKSTKKSDDESSSDGDGDHDESYDNIEGAYNPKDYQQLNVTAEVRDLFQYIERYKPQEVELETPLKCFIPEYIPAIGELDAFIKIPRPDGKEDNLGLKYLDEPSNNQSDPTVLELQLRAKSKKLQYGDIVVRSIENADKHPLKIDKWIQDISEIHRSKPPPQVNYKRNFPDIEKLMDVWPEEFENLLAHVPLPSPDLDLTLSEYTKILCTILDIPTYDNPIESLHLMFSLFIEFRNNPHFQARLMDGDYNGNEAGMKNISNGKYYGADILEIEPDYNSL